MKRYIAQKKGHEVNWAKTTTSIAQEKAQRKEVGKLKSGSLELSDLNAGGKGSMQFNNKLTMDIKPTLEVKGSRSSKVYVHMKFLHQALKRL